MPGRVSPDKGGTEMRRMESNPSPAERPREIHSPETRQNTRATDFVTSNLLSYVVESFDYAEAQLFPLLIFVDDDIFNVAHQTKIVYAVRKR